MQKTLIDPFEAASRTLPAEHDAAAPTRKDADASQESADAVPRKATPSEPWARVRFWCSED